MGPSYTYRNRQGETGDEDFGYLPMASTCIKAGWDCRCFTCQNSEILLLDVVKQQY